MSFEKEIEEHELRTQKVLAMGGEKRVERQRAMGRLNARQRIDYLIDPESFLEIGRAYGATETQIFTKIVLPASVPYIMAGVRLAVGMAIIGIIVSEFFTAITGLGGIIVLYANNFATAKLFVPRWSVHQSQNQGDGEMVILAITDFYLTGKALVGDYEFTNHPEDIELLTGM